jgi:hypothetical protein
MRGRCRILIGYLEGERPQENTITNVSLKNGI